MGGQKDTSPCTMPKELMATRTSLRVQYLSNLAKTSKPDQAAAPLPAWPISTGRDNADLITAEITFEILQA